MDHEVNRIRKMKTMLVNNMRTQWNLLMLKTKYESNNFTSIFL